MPSEQQLVVAEGQLMPFVGSRGWLPTFDSKVAHWLVHTRDAEELKRAAATIGWPKVLDFGASPHLYELPITVVEDTALAGLGPKLMWRE